MELILQPNIQVNNLLSIIFYLLLIIKLIKYDHNFLEIPTAVFSNLRLIRDKLSWDPPKNCFTISGPIQLAKLVFTGSSKSVITYQDIRQTSNYYFVLGSQNQTIYGAEHYFVNVYIARIHNGTVNINVSNYQRLEFLAPPKGNIYFSYFFLK